MLECAKEPELVLHNWSTQLGGEVVVIHSTEGIAGVNFFCRVAGSEVIVLPVECGAAVKIVGPLTRHYIEDGTLVRAVLGRRPQGKHLDLFERVVAGSYERRGVSVEVVGQIDAVELVEVLVNVAAVRSGLRAGLPLPRLDARCAGHDVYEAAALVGRVVNPIPVEVGLNLGRLGVDHRRGRKDSDRLGHPF